MIQERTNKDNLEKGMIRNAVWYRIGVFLKLGHNSNLIDSGILFDQSVVSSGKQVDDRLTSSIRNFSDE